MLHWSNKVSATNGLSISSKRPIPVIDWQLFTVEHFFNTVSTNTIVDQHNGVFYHYTTSGALIRAQRSYCGFLPITRLPIFRLMYQFNNLDSISWLITWCAWWLTHTYLLATKVNCSPDHQIFSCDVGPFQLQRPSPSASLLMYLWSSYQFRTRCHT